MIGKFTPSVNIIRDLDKPLDYILTPNAELVFEQMDNNYTAGIHSFNIIGSFGTGKSSFLVAFEKQLKGESIFFDFSPICLNGSKESKFINIIGSYRSIREAFAKAIGSKATDTGILADLHNYYRRIQEENKQLIIIVDEFGKFLEYAAANNPEKEMYFIQQVSEFVNDVSKDILFITTLHQNFQAYMTGLSLKQRTEWEKVKGRFKEITFNEPVEQLLFLAARYLDNKTDIKEQVNHKEFIDIILKTKAFPLDDRFFSGFERRLLPFDVAAAAVLTLSLQRYGQNERSLFLFLKSRDINGLDDYDRSSNPYYNLNCVYNYMIQNFYSYLSTKYNPDYMQWSAIRNALERAAAIFEGNHDAAAKIVKTIGLLNIFASKSAKIDRYFLLKYSRLGLGIENPGEVIQVLEDKKIIRFLKFKQCFILFEGTDLDIELAIQKAASHVDLPTDIVPILKERFQFPYILAKAAFYRAGTPRFFEVIFSNQPIKKCPTGQVDGFVNLIFNETLDLSEIRSVSKETGAAIFYGLYQNLKKIRDIIWELEKLNYVLRQNDDDRVAQRELKEMISHLNNELNRKILNSLYTSAGNVVWFFQGEEEKINNRKALYRILSKISEAVYFKAPIYRNELINHHRLSSNIASARKNLIVQLLEHWEDKDLGFSPDHYPPEKTIYLTLLKDMKMHREDEDGYMTLSKPQEESFIPLWERCEDFLEDTKKGEKSAADLIDLLSEKPFKLKQGFLEFWIPIFLFIKRDSFALFYGDAYVPELTSDILLIITKEPNKYFIKAFDIKGLKLELFNKYRMLVKKGTEERMTNLSFVDTIKPFLTFYISLPDYTKKTKRLSPTALALRDAIAKAKDPEKTFFVDFPDAFGYTIEQLTTSSRLLEEFIHRLRDGVYEIKNCFEQLIDRIESFLKVQLGLQNVDFSQYKKELQVRYKSLKRYLLLPHQKAFFSRLHSELDDRTSWLKSIIQGVLDKSIEMLEDEEEEIVCKKLSHMFLELDNLCELSEIQVDKEKEEIFKLAVTTLTEGTREHLIRYPKSKTTQNKKLKSAIEKILNIDKNTNIMVLFTLLKEQLENE
jgi:hypothetical protein